MSSSSKRRGNCYVTAEALFHLLGGKKEGYVVHRVKHEGDTHWYLVLDRTYIIDPTAKQFRNPPPYHKGRATGFLTKKPSKRARAMMKAMVWQ